MGGLQLDCPLCCDKSFDSKDALLEHLVDVTNNLFCPICNSKWSSLEGLTEHLTVNDCQSEQNDGIQNIVIYEQSMDNIDNSEDIKDSDVKTLSPELSSPDTQYITDETYESQDETGEVNKMYVELLGKQLSKPVLQTQELKLIKEDGENHYMIVTQDDDELTEDSAIVTKQNNDGTISLTTVKDIKLDPDTLIVPEPDLTEDKQKEIYSCNTCKVSFTSVLDHIQNYHNDQEVVLEEGDEDITLGDKQTARRVITDTGDIVEEPMIFKSDDTEIQQDTIDAIIKHPKLVLDKQGRAYTRRFVQIDKVPETVSEEAPPTVPEKTDYHQVVTKQLQMKTGLTVKMYNCMSCNITVSDLNEFKDHPCKITKYPCPKCPAGYENARSLCAHMKVHKENPDGSPAVVLHFVCEVCSTVFKTNKSLKLHKRMHDPIKSRPIQPPVNHRGNKDVSGHVYHCNICDKVIPYDYRAVHENSHKSNNKMNCGVCNKKFTSMEFLEMHMNIHNLDKVPMNKQDKTLPYKCLFCNRRFARPHEKVKHERIHTGEKPHSCEICGKSFRVLYCLTLHMRTHTGARPYECAHCGKRFKAHSVYSHHLLTHSDVRAYKCPYCPKAFKTSVQLAGHKNSHTKPFSCQHCNRPFASLYAVRIHTETHNRQNNLKFSCTMCGASYARAFALKDHMKQVHKKDLDSVDNLVENSTEETEDWMTRDTTTEPEGMQSLNKELQETITDLEMSANELIIP
ncbi:unnamed protein product [Arctia plantaginis]|uniref:C2H2-type domain-containing protein n=1 Tax=Arctia plantaginis TaxID=874455 RepID=A0A8S0ZL46_ARCPL|nr:unnamed protein product [Arctia plantaginis]CAB3253436.1 unnamed protein product [Arctia plantaginis]